MLEFLKEQPEPVKELPIMEVIEGRRAIKQKTLRKLVKGGTITRTGSGRKGAPYLYSYSGFSGTQEAGTSIS